MHSYGKIGKVPKINGEKIRGQGMGMEGELLVRPLEVVAPMLEDGTVLVSESLASQVQCRVTFWRLDNAEMDCSASFDNVLSRRKCG
jgi:hypothetical protein